MSNSSSRTGSYYLTTCRIYGLLKYFGAIPPDALDRQLARVIGALPAVTDHAGYAVLIEECLFGSSAAPPSLPDTMFADSDSPDANTVFLERSSKYLKRSDQCLNDFSWIRLDTNLSRSVRLRLLRILADFRPYKSKRIKIRNGALIDHHEGAGHFEAPAAYVLALFKFWNVINYFYPYKMLLAEGWDRTFESHYTRFVDAASREAYIKAIQVVAARLNDSHVFVRDMVRTQSRNRIIPLRLKYAGKRLCISAVYSRPGEASPLAVGDEILGIGDLSVNELYEDYLLLKSHSNPAAADARFGDYLVTRFKSSDAVSISHARNDKLLRSMLATMSPQEWREWVLPTENAKRPPICRIIDGSTGYLHFESTTFFNFNRHFRKIKRLPNLILDCRGYGTLAMFKLLRRLNRKSQDVSGYRYPLAKIPGVTRAGKRENFFTRTDLGVFWRLVLGMPVIPGKLIPGFGAVYKGRVYVLIDAQVISYGETVLMAIRRYRPDATFVGMHTTGANGNVCSVTLPEGLSVHYSGIDYHFSNGAQVQQVGIRANVVVEDEHRPGPDMDAVLDRALQLIKA